MILVMIWRVYMGREFLRIKTSKKNLFKNKIIFYLIFFTERKGEEILMLLEKETEKIKQEEYILKFNQFLNSFKLRNGKNIDMVQIEMNIKRILNENDLEMICSYLKDLEDLFEISYIQKTENKIVIDEWA